MSRDLGFIKRRARGDSMFLLNNIYDRRYRDIYPGIGNVVFDISDSQLRNARNEAWHKIVAGSIVCVVSSSRKISTFHLVEANFESDVFDPESGRQHVITGKVVGKLPLDTDMTRLLAQFGVSNKLLPGNKFSIGFNVADLGEALSSLPLNTKTGSTTLGHLEAGL